MQLAAAFQRRLVRGYISTQMRAYAEVALFTFVTSYQYIHGVI
jgi:hypothetical protein